MKTHLTNWQTSFSVSYLKTKNISFRCWYILRNKSTKATPCIILNRQFYDYNIHAIVILGKRKNTHWWFKYENSQISINGADVMGKYFHGVLLSFKL